VLAAYSSTLVSTNVTFVHLIPGEPLASAESTDRRQDLILQPFAALEVCFLAPDLEQNPPDEATHRRVLLRSPDPDAPVDIWGQ